MTTPPPVHADALVRSIHPAAHTLRAVTRRFVRYAGVNALDHYDRHFYPQRIERSADQSLPLIRGSLRKCAPSNSRALHHPPRVVHAIGSLSAGGAERQLASFVSTSQRTGLVRHAVLTCHPTTGSAGHYRPLLEGAGVDIRTLGEQLSERAARRIRSSCALRRRMIAIPTHLGYEPIEVAGEFLDLEPDVVHAWLDHTNIFAGVAAIATGAPRVILSLRSLAPTHFPNLLCDWMQPWYRVLADEPCVTMVANSDAGAADYARWIGIARERIGVIRNGFDTTQFTAPLDIDVANARAALGAIGRPLVLGIFRLSDEKQPHQFVHVARRVLKRLPNCVFAIVGDGPMLAEIHRSTVDLGDSFVTLGRRSDVPALIACADAMLLCSRVEGLPNVLIEAQAFGCPVVATDAGGTKETMIPDETGFLCPVGDVAGLSDAILRLLIDSELRARMSARAKSFARERFPIERMVRETHRLYGMHDGGL